MEVDITGKVHTLLKRFLVVFVIVLTLGLTGIFIFQYSWGNIRITDAEVQASIIPIKLQATGRVSEFLVEDGAYVEAGTVIAKIRVHITDEELVQLEQAVEYAKNNLLQIKKGQIVRVSTPPSTDSSSTYNLEQARVRVERMKELFDMGAISAAKLKGVENDYNVALAASQSTRASNEALVYQESAPEAIEQAKAQLAAAETALRNAKEDALATEVVAPRSGTIYWIVHQNGEELKAGTLVAQLGDSTEMWVETPITEVQHKSIHLGQLVQMKIGGQDFVGIVQSVEDSKDDLAGEKNDERDGDTERKKMRISLPEDSKNIHPGMKATIRLKNYIPIF